MQTVDVGETVPIIVTVWDADGVGAEPDDLALTITAPDGTQNVINKGDADLVGTDSGSGNLDTWTYPLELTAGGVWRYSSLATLNGQETTESGILLAGDAAQDEGPCEPWCTWEDIVATCPSVDLSSLDAGQREQLIDTASWVLYALDGARYPGYCQVTRRLCRGCRTCGCEPCGCASRDALDLGGRWPVIAAWDVTVDGDEILPSQYEVRDRRWLARTDDLNWPTSSDLSDPDAFTATWLYGRRPPIGLRAAAARFVAEMAKSCLGLKCELPQRVTSITREQVSYVILDPQRFLDEGRTGIYSVDLALIAAKKGRRGGPGGFSPLTRRTHSSRVG
jgi:hypothetical protein